MSLNIDLKVLSANGCYDLVTPSYQTMLDLKAMPLLDADVRKNLSAGFYPPEYAVYLNDGSRTALKTDLVCLYDATTTDHQAVTRIHMLQTRRT